LAQLVGSQKTSKGDTLNTFLVRRESEDWKVYGPSNVHAKWGVRPDQMADYLLLVGDTSDHIPGVRGIGKKTAPNLLSVYGSVEKLLLKSSGCQPDEFLEKFKQKELVLSACPGLTQKMADALSDSLEFLPERRELLELTPRKVYIPEEWLSPRAKKGEITAAMRLLGSYGLSDMAAKVAEGRVWAKRRAYNS